MIEVITVFDASSSAPVGLFISSARCRVRVEELGLYPATGRAPITRSGFAGRDLVQE